MLLAGCGFAEPASEAPSEASLADRAGASAAPAADASASETPGLRVTGIQEPGAARPDRPPRSEPSLREPIAAYGVVADETLTAGLVIRPPDGYGVVEFPSEQETSEAASDPDVETALLGVGDDRGDLVAYITVLRFTAEFLASPAARGRAALDADLAAGETIAGQPVALVDGWISWYARPDTLVQVGPAEGGDPAQVRSVAEALVAANP